MRSTVRSNCEIDGDRPGYTSHLGIVAASRQLHRKFLKSSEATGLDFLNGFCSSPPLWPRFLPIAASLGPRGYIEPMRNKTLCPHLIQKNHSKHDVFDQQNHSATGADALVAMCLLASTAPTSS